MKKIIAYIVLSLFLGIYFISVNNPLMRNIAPYRYEWNSIFGADNYKYGDLYGLSYLSDFKTLSKVENIPLQDPSLKKNIDFYCVCDSYVWSFPIKDSVLYGVNKYFQSRWTYDESIEKNLDTTKINFLLIEMSERSARDFLSDSSDIYSRLTIDGYTLEKETTKNKKNYAKLIEKALANPKLNKNLEFNLFDYRFLTPLRELKADIIYKLFARVNADVVISADKNYLFYKPTIDTATKESSFKYLSNEEVDHLVQNLNSIKEYYLHKGLNYVYFSIIPNPVSMLEPDMFKYNELVQRIQNNPGLKVPYIDAYGLLKKEHQAVFQRSDSHWNAHGFNLWLKDVNKVLKNIYK